MGIQLEIVKIVPPGDGLGYFNNKTVFVPGTTVGDVVEATIVKEKKRHIHASLTKILTPGNDRIQTPCPHYQECGGCSLMHLSYTNQLQLKQQLLTEVFGNHGLEISPGFLPSPQTDHYRHRTTVKLKDGIIGFSARQSHHVVPIDECLILSRGIKNQLDSFKNLGRNNCEFSLLESSDNGEIAVCVTEKNRLVPLPRLRKTTDLVHYSCTVMVLPRPILSSRRPSAMLLKKKSLPMTKSVSYIVVPEPFRCPWQKKLQHWKDLMSAKNRFRQRLRIQGKTTWRIPSFMSRIWKKALRCLNATQLWLILQERGLEVFRSNASALLKLQNCSMSAVTRLHWHEMRSL